MNLSNEESRKAGKNEEECLDVGTILSSFRPIFSGIRDVVCARSLKLKPLPNFLNLMKTILLVIASDLFISSQSTAECSEHVGCYAEWGDAELTVGNALVERKWTIRKGLLARGIHRVDQDPRQGLRHEISGGFSGSAATPLELKVSAHYFQLRPLYAQVTKNGHRFRSRASTAVRGAPAKLDAFMEEWGSRRKG